MAANPDQKVLEYVSVTQAALEKAGAVIAAFEGRVKKAADKVEGVVEALVTHGRIRPEDKEAAVKALADHGQALEMITKLAGRRDPGAPAAIGKPQGRTKVANSLTNPRVGVRTAEPKESDLAYERRLGITRS